MLHNKPLKQIRYPYVKILKGNLYSICDFHLFDTEFTNDFSSTRGCVIFFLVMHDLLKIK